MDLAEFALRAVGAFYIFAGLVATRAAVMSHFFDRAIAAFSMKRTPAVERHLFLWLLGSATLVLAGGAAVRRSRPVSSSAPMYAMLPAWRRPRRMGAAAR